MPVCINIIANEGMRSGWLTMLTDDDINRILARYKEHVNYWNIAIQVIEGELQTFANAIDAGHDYNEVVTKFNSIPPKAFQPDIIFSHAQVRKEVFSPFQPNATTGTWVPASFLQDEINRILGWLSISDQSSSVRLINQSLCELHGSFTRDELLEFLHNLQETTGVYQGQQFQYDLISIG